MHGPTQPVFSTNFVGSLSESGGGEAFLIGSDLGPVEVNNLRQFDISNTIKSKQKTHNISFQPISD